MEISGHAAVVTGGASGLGAATCHGAGTRGGQGRLHGYQPRSRAQGGEGDRRPCRTMRRRRSRGLRCRAGRGARKARAPARILINCAGVGPAKRIVGRDGPMPLSDFERVIKINLIGTFNMMRLAAVDMQSLPPLAEGERGVIITAASVAAFEGQIGQAAYSASKGGVAALTHAGCAGVCAIRHSRRLHRAGHLSDAHADGHPRGSRRRASRPRYPFRRRWAVPISSRPWRGISSRTPTSTAR